MLNKKRLLKIGEVFCNRNQLFYRINVIARCEGCCCSVGGGGRHLTNFFRAAVAGNKNSLGCRFTGFINNCVASAVKLNYIFKRFILRDKTYGNEKSVNRKLSALPCRIFYYNSPKLRIAEEGFNRNSRYYLNIFKLIKLIRKLLFACQKIKILNNVNFFARSESKIASCKAEFPPPTTATVLFL